MIPSKGINMICLNCPKPTQELIASYGPNLDADVMIAMYDDIVKQRDNAKLDLTDDHIMAEVNAQYFEQLNNGKDHFVIVISKTTTELLAELEDLSFEYLLVELQHLRAEKQRTADFCEMMNQLKRAHNEFF